MSVTIDGTTYYTSSEYNRVKDQRDDYEDDWRDERDLRRSLEDDVDTLEGEKAALEGTVTELNEEIVELNRQGKENLKQVFLALGMDPSVAERLANDGMLAGESGSYSGYSSDVQEEIKVVNTDKLDNMLQDGFGIGNSSLSRSIAENLMSDSPEDVEMGTVTIIFIAIFGEDVVSDNYSYSSGELT